MSVIARNVEKHQGRDYQGVWRLGELKIIGKKYYIVTWNATYQVDPKTVELVKL